LCGACPFASALGACGGKPLLVALDKLLHGLAQAGDDACAGEPAVDTPAGTGDDAFAAGLRVQKAFAGEHLGAWLGSVVASLDAHDASRIYFALGQAMEQFVESDKQWLSAACA